MDTSSITSFHEGVNNKMKTVERFPFMDTSTTQNFDISKFMKTRELNSGSNSESFNRKVDKLMESTERLGGVYCPPARFPPLLPSLPCHLPPLPPPLPPLPSRKGSIGAPNTQINAIGSNQHQLRIPISEKTPKKLMEVIIGRENTISEKTHRKIMEAIKGRQNAISEKAHRKIMEAIKGRRHHDRSDSLL